ncbi:inhibin beta A chain-like [Saccostrea echinata]|uniref:inhibin beta A chain-like n=1 Tax=Saccostrea echinata TaxID=191078 RepID=UPI002A7F4217|nr:inhibin beta A chain-like [Saccostrea echinata]
MWLFFISFDIFCFHSNLSERFHLPLYCLEHSRKKMAFKVHVITARYYGVFVSLYVLLCSINADNFPGKKVDFNKMIQRERSLKIIRDAILTKLGRPPQDDPGVTEEESEKSVTTPLKHENKCFTEIQEIIAFSEPVENITSDNIFKFSMTKDNRTHEIQSASVLVQVKFKRRRKNSRKKAKPRRIRLILSTVDEKGRKLQQISSRKAKISRTNWFKLFLPKSLIEAALKSDNANIKLHIRCKGCKKFAKLVLLHGTKRKRKRAGKTKGRRKRHRLRSRKLDNRKLSRTRPFLLIHTKINIRDKRQTNECHTQMNQCCKIPLVFSFAEAGWSDWVISPPSFKTNMCIGGCNSGSHWDRKFNYTYHCTEKKNKPLRIMYFDNTGAVIISKLPRMIVTECGCS